MHISVLQTLIQDIISEGQDTARRMRHQGLAVPNPCLMYKWHGKAYLGAAHGVVGVLHVRTHPGSHLVSVELAFRLRRPLPSRCSLLQTRQPQRMCRC